mgnify:CR=1 FL=1
MSSPTIHLSEYLKLITRIASLQGHGNRHYDQVKTEKKDQRNSKSKNENNLDEK